MSNTDSLNSTIPDTVLITGATGFIGKATVQHFLNEGYRVRALVRPTGHWPFDPHPLLEKFQGDMQDHKSLILATDSVKWVVHLATAKSDEPDSWETNVTGAQHLVDACQINHIQAIVNVSTQSTKLMRKGIYGRTKHQADTLFHNASVPTMTLLVSVVYGDLTSGVFGSLARFSQWPITPVIGNGRCRFRPIYRDDLARSIVQLISQPFDNSKVMDIGGPDLISLNQLIDILSKKLGKISMRLHLPIWFGLLVGTILTFLRFPLITVSNVRGSTEEIPMDLSLYLNTIDFLPRNLEQGLQTILSCRMEEGISLLAYSASSFDRHWKPKPALIAKYMRALESLQINSQHRLDRSVLRKPSIIGGLDAASRILAPNCILQQKLKIAASLMECDPDSANWLLPSKQSTVSMVCFATAMLLRIIHKGLLALLLLCFRRFYTRNTGL
ncbi:MAG: NAD-dependent epimerase/dehydratase family protein [Planctomycetota bacterium]|nr:NAD-dependent epimerase/dehydratase family protein [Planctomycetota bacterium]